MDKKPDEPSWGTWIVAVLVLSAGGLIGKSDDAVAWVKRWVGQGAAVQPEPPPEPIPPPVIEEIPAHFEPSVIVWRKQWDSGGGEFPDEYLIWPYEKYRQALDNSSETYAEAQQHSRDGQIIYGDGYGWYFKKMSDIYNSSLDLEAAKRDWESQGFIFTVDAFN